MDEGASDFSLKPGEREAPPRRCTMEGQTLKFMGYSTHTAFDLKDGLEKACTQGLVMVRAHFGGCSEITQVHDTT